MKGQDNCRSTRQKFVCGKHQQMALFIGRIAREATPKDLENLFGKYGKMTRCDLKKGKKKIFLLFYTARIWFCYI